MRRTTLLGLAGTAGIAALAASSMMEPRLQLHECDWSIYERGSSRRSFLSPSHFLYHLRELLSVQAALAEVYLLHAISPAFRESIMLVTAMANECSW
ncbi:MAG: hypothetical protein AB1384_13310 [Actinomycetota bacterium]